MSYPLPFFFLFAFGVSASSWTHISLLRSSPLMPLFFKYLTTVFPVFCANVYLVSKYLEFCSPPLTFQLESAPFLWLALVLSLDLMTMTPLSVAPS